jgi:hypothetical protein
LFALLAPASSSQVFRQAQGGARQMGPALSKLKARRTDSLRSFLTDIALATSVAAISFSASGDPRRAMTLGEELPGGILRFHLLS